MKRIRVHRTGLIAAALGAVVLLAACSSSSSSTDTGAGSSTGTGTSSASSVSSAQTTTLGTVLVDDAGRTLYLFMPEKGSVVACTGSCATTWPPLLAGSGSSGSAMNGAKSSMLGTVALSGGQKELTYNGWPLHTYAGDSEAGQTNGQGIGGQWFAVTVSGDAAGSASNGGSNAGGSSSGNDSTGSGSSGNGGSGNGGGYGGGY